jgi:hypothetical protein
MHFRITDRDLLHFLIRPIIMTEKQNGLVSLLVFQTQETQTQHYMIDKMLENLTRIDDNNVLLKHNVDLSIAGVVGGCGVDTEHGHSSLGPAEDGSGGSGAVRHLIVGVVRLQKNCSLVVF